jgi:hypothetical protein
MAETAPLKYRAFLTYDRHDKTWGDWLHAELAGYRTNKDLRGRETPVGPVPKSLRPIYCDSGESYARLALNAQTSTALESSKFLVVLCSPNAAQNEYINEEVRRFKSLGRADRVIPIIVNGEPKQPERECIPPAVWFGPTGEREEMTPFDGRRGADRQKIVKQKVVAGLLGLPLDDLRRSAERARRQRIRIVLACNATFMVIAAVGSVALYGWQPLLDLWQQFDLHELLVRLGVQ